MGVGLVGAEVQQVYSPEQVDQALMALISFGSSKIAAAAVEEAFGFTVPPTTLRGWRSIHHDRYQELLRIHGEELEQKAVAAKRALLPLLEHGIALGVEKTIDELDAGDAKDPSASARNLAVVSGIQTRDLMLLTDRPTDRREVTSPEDLYRQLAQVLKGEDEEIPEAEVVSEDSGEAVAVPATQRDTSSQRARS